MVLEICGSWKFNLILGSDIKFDVEQIKKNKELGEIKDQSLKRELIFKILIA